MIEDKKVSGYFELLPRPLRNGNPVSVKNGGTTKIASAFVFLGHPDRG